MRVVVAAIVAKQLTVLSRPSCCFSAKLCPQLCRNSVAAHLAYPVKYFQAALFIKHYTKNLYLCRFSMLQEPSLLHYFSNSLMFRARVNENYVTGNLFQFIQNLCISFFVTETCPLTIWLPRMGNPKNSGQVVWNSHEFSVYFYHTGSNQLLHFHCSSSCRFFTSDMGLC